MNCKRFEAALLGVMDGRASAREREKLATHVAECAACAERLQAMQAVWTRLDRMEVTEPSLAFDARLRARMAEAPVLALRSGWVPSRLWLVAVAAVLLAAGAWISLRPLLHRLAPPANQNQEDFAVVKNLAVLENYDVLLDFDAFSALPGAQATQEQQPTE